MFSEAVFRVLLTCIDADTKENDHYYYQYYDYCYSALTSIVVLFVHYASAINDLRAQYYAKRLLNKTQCTCYMSLQSFAVSILFASMVFEMPVGK